jgi:hypothetical protein
MNAYIRRFVSDKKINFQLIFIYVIDRGRRGGQLLAIDFKMQQPPLLISKMQQPPEKNFSMFRATFILLYGTNCVFGNVSHLFSPKDLFL